MQNKDWILKEIVTTTKILLFDCLLHNKTCKAIDNFLSDPSKVLMQKSAGFLQDSLATKTLKDAFISLLGIIFSFKPGILDFYGASLAGKI